ncbi:hypothetical protein [Tsukamurella ocularis]|uniref:hypothetical protein n=1 Tax=Tsukamurella ocularis TaxID=1970234 RepID=UPI0021698E46|nr:hypothetical protein [Tsukamurella ocularis]MCS3782246.1 DNA-binding transcriptional LysR family regulator [Tsukamurella ocularis]MCS3789594.1 DNA-binding transcriptional LysR family regulator [Tsukamurella ocularis]MCS3852741.1 DNA-binding transcriptional LysR family regulator [Tsukamurella ocularis]
MQFRHTTPAPAGLPALAIIERIVADIDELSALSGTAQQSVTISRTAGVGLPDHLEGKVTRWNREHELQIHQVIVDDPVAALRSGESDLAVALVTGPRLEGFEAVPVRVWSRGRRVELLNRPDLRSQARAVVDHLS